MPGLDRSSRLPLIAGIAFLAVVIIGGGSFLRLGMDQSAPQQSNVHKILPVSAFIAKESGTPLPSLAPVPSVSGVPMIAVPVPAAANRAPAGTTVAVAPAVAPAPGPSTPLPTLPAPKALPGQGAVAQ
ncbi:hypothetical protein D5366_05785 [Neokomagataea tanensis]|uniref:Uncharacterized protein n=1 Tax=Neokomagataea tanensis TaxID=661191 RepID=A0A4Y6V419_9PROT|nr:MULTISPECIES: hypothetical protein [Neokomagataea]QDH24809.1 hypothetical protein D5366_05785 [Neokomagataea tanensis]